MNFYAYYPGDLLSRDGNMALVVNEGTMTTFTVRWVTGSNVGKQLTYRYGQRPVFEIMSPA